MLWFKNTTVGYRPYCGPSCLTSALCIGSPNCQEGVNVTTVSSADGCCDPRKEAQFYPMRKGQAMANYIRGAITVCTVVLCA